VSFPAQNFPGSKVERAADGGRERERERESARQEVQSVDYPDVPFSTCRCCLSYRNELKSRDCLRARRSVGREGSRSRRDFYARRFRNSRSYGIGSHKLRSTRVLSHVRGLDVRSHALSLSLPLSLISILFLWLAGAAATFVASCTCNCTRHTFAFLILSYFLRTDPRPSALLLLATRLSPPYPLFRPSAVSASRSLASRLQSRVIGGEYLSRLDETLALDRSSTALTA
jgi:hypothetical protein